MSDRKVESDVRVDTKSGDSVRQNVSFKFSKSSTKKLAGNKLEEDDPPKGELITSVEDKEIKSAVPKEEKKELVIPLIRKNTWRISGKTDHNILNEKERALHEMAVKEVLKESSMKNEKWEKRETNLEITIPLLVQNKVPEGYETDDKMDVSLRPDESTLEHYEKVPVDAFGLAVLRGMGWKPGDPIGGKNKQCVTPVEAVLRPKGLGLGADKNALQKTVESEPSEEKLELLKNAYVLVTGGPHKGLYGQVEGLDDENARAIVKLTTVDKCVTLPEFFTKVISKKQFQKESKVINKLAYDKYIEESKDIRKECENGESHDRDNNDNSSKRKEHERSRDRSSDSRESSHHKKRKHSKESKSEKNEKKHSSSERNEKSDMWVSTQLRVRFIDNQYKKGKYFNQKMVVEDILSSKYCVCRTEDGKYLDDVKPSMLETVIPRSEPPYVMIVRGKYKGQLGVILKKDKANCVATVQLLADREKVTKLEYDSICEYLGDVSQFD